jgi:epoxyqueuosine reductase
MTPSALAMQIKEAGRRLGFDRVAVGPAGPPEHAAAFESWLDAGHAGTMGYLERGRDKRMDPERVLPGARSVVACALGYYQGGEPRGRPGSRGMRGARTTTASSSPGSARSPT